MYLSPREYWIGRKYAKRPRASLLDYCQWQLRRLILINRHFVMCNHHSFCWRINILLCLFYGLWETYRTSVSYQIELSLSFIVYLYKLNSRTMTMYMYGWIFTGLEFPTRIQVVFCFSLRSKYVILTISGSLHWIIELNWILFNLWQLSNVNSFLG